MHFCFTQNCLLPKIHNMKATSLILAIFLTANIAFSQAPRIKFDRISLAEGLSQSTINDIVQDEQGFMWFATLDGLNKFDGYKMTLYSNNPDDEFALSDNVLNRLHVQKNGDTQTLWVGTAGQGLCRYSRINDNFETFTHDPNNEKTLSSNKITAITGNENKIWVGTEFGLNRLNTTTGEVYRYHFKKQGALDVDVNFITKIEEDEQGIVWVGTKAGLASISAFTMNENGGVNHFTKEKSLPLGEITALYVSPVDNTLWFGTKNGVFNFDDRTWKSTQVHIEGQATSYEITSIISDKEGIIWAGTKSAGLLRYSPKENSFHFYTHDPTSQKSISTDGITKLYLDKTNILWVGTSLGGINKWNRAADDLIVFRHNPYDEHSLSANQVRNIYKDKQDEIWIGTVEGGLNKWNKEDNYFIHYGFDPNNPNSISHNHIRSILEDSFGNFWVATDGGGLNKFDRKTLKFKRYKNKPEDDKSISHNRVWKVCQDTKGNLWVGTYGGGLNLYSYETDDFTSFKCEKTEKSLCSNQVTAIIQNDENSLWVGTFGGVSLFDISTGVFTNYSNNKKDKNSLSNNRVYSLHQDEDKVLWVGTKGGLNKFNSETKGFQRYTTYNTENMPNNVLTGILEDNSGNLWFATNKGIARFNKKTTKIRSFDVRDGLQSNEFLAGSVFKSSDGEMFFGGINGFNAFFPERIKDNPNKPSMVITGFQISNQKIELDSAVSEKKLIKLKYFQNDISFDFVALDFIFPEKNKYKYQLVGNDDDWVNAKYRRFASYTNLSPGTYYFNLKGSNNDEVWSDEVKQIMIVIKPAWWQTLAFKIISVFLVGLIVFVVYKIRMKRIKEYNKQLEKEVKEQTSEIRQQNEEIVTQNEEILGQKNEIEKQNDEITASIKYAKRIQTAALPAPRFLKENLPEHFILFKPKDIVSGDFYWAGKQGSKIIITAADCTGHGVPGAFMSMLGISYLNEIVNIEKVTEPGEILNRLRKSIISALKQQGTGAIQSKDGMDIALTVIDTEEGTVNFAGAYNPLFWIRNGELSVIKADKMPVAVYDRMDDFSPQVHQFEKGDTFYMFSDGYADQFGGPRGKKFMTKKFKRLLVENSTKPMVNQKEILNNSIESWMKEGQEEQIDDIVVVGVRL